MRRRPHKPFASGFDSRLRYHSKRRLARGAIFFLGLLDHSGGHLPCKQESGVRIPGSPPFLHSIAGRLVNQ